jgi:hypothetical protein
MDGGKLVFNMIGRPSNWATKDEEIPKTELTENLIIPSPYIAKGDVAFKKQTEISLGVASPKTDIYYSLNDSDFKKYSDPFTISEESVLKTYAEKLPLQPSARNLGKRSSLLTTHFYKIDPNLSITLETEYANQYNGGGNNALIDGVHGAIDFRTGAWQGYHDIDLKAFSAGPTQLDFLSHRNFLLGFGKWKGFYGLANTKNRGRKTFGRSRD